MENEKKKGKGSLIVIVLLIILVIGLGGYIGYDKFLNQNNVNTTDETTGTDNIKEDENCKEVPEDSNSLKTRMCTGVYSGTAVVSYNIQTKENNNGLLAIELKEDGTYELKKDNMMVAAGEFTIIDSALLLKTSPDTCGPNADCSAKYSQYLSISDDCSSISWGYGSYFFDPNFTLKK